MKSGKRLEQNVKASAEELGLFIYRLKDSGTSFGTNANIRFTSSNMCDYLVFNGKKLLCLELKNHKGKSLPLSCVRDNQVVELTKAIQYENVIAGLLVYFEDWEQCYFLDIETFNAFKEVRKSIPLEFFKRAGKELKVKMKKTNYFINIGEIFYERPSIE